jgi:voltage-gated potassium channel Kch
MQPWTFFNQLNFRGRGVVPAGPFISHVVLATAMFLLGMLVPIALPAFASNAWGASSGNDAAEEEPNEFYQYTDKDGVIHFVDSIGNIPPRYRNKLIVRKESTAARNTTEVKIIDKQIHVPVSIRNRDRTAQANLILDTGASITCITEELAGRLGIDLENAIVVSMGMADGRMIDIRVTEVDSVSVGDRIKSPFKIGILPRLENRQAHEGYLGLDFLSGFQHRIDFQNSLIRWQ